MAFELEPADPAHASALDRLATRRIAWLGTNGRDGFPHHTPVWFVWRDGAAVIFVQPHAAKTRNLRADPRASLSFETDASGEEWMLLQGTVEFTADPALVWFGRFREAYLAKYADGLAALDWTIERLTEEFSLAVLFHPHKLIA